MLLPLLLTAFGVLAPEQDPAQAAQQREWELWLLTGQAPSTLSIEAHPNAQLAWHMAQLAPRIEGAVREEQQAQSVQALLEAWSANEVPVEWQDYLYTRLRGKISHAARTQILTILEMREVPRRQDLVSLLVSWPVAGAPQELLDFVLNEQQPAPLRARLVEAMLLVEGHDMLVQLLPSVHAEAEVMYLSRVFAGWRQCVQPEDMERLEAMVTSLSEVPAQYALQLWALNEEDPEARLRILRLALQAPANYRQVALDALATQGTDPTLTAELRKEFDTIDPKRHNAAMRLLPRFGGPEALWEEYLLRGKNASPSQRAMWMRDLALSPLPEAKAEAAAWLAQGGWRSSVGMTLARILQGSEEVDPILPTLLHDAQVPDRIRYPLALERAPHSEAARDFLRQALQGQDRLRRGQAIRALGAAGQEQDLFRLAALAQDPATDDRLRALVMTVLAPHPDASLLVQQWQETPAQGYESAVALMTSLLLGGTPEQQQWARSFALSSPEGLAQDEQRGLRIELWQKIGNGAKAQNVPFLEEHIAAHIQSLPMRPVPTGAVEESWNHFARALQEFGELDAMLAAYRSCLAGVPIEEEVSQLLLETDVSRVPPQMLAAAALRLADMAPTLASHWLALSEAEARHPDNLLRIASIRAGMLAQKPGEAEAMRALLAQPEALAAAPRLLAQGFPVVGIGWTLWQDRLQERLLLAEIESGERPAADLGRFGEQWCEADFAERVLNASLERGNSLLQALLLAEHFVALHPLSGELRNRLASLYEQNDQPEAARRQWQAVLRLRAPTTAAGKGAVAGLKRLNQ